MYSINSNDHPTTFFLNSRFALTRTPVFNFPMSSTIQIDPNKFFLVTLSEFICTNTIPVIRSHNNALSFTRAGTSFTVYVTSQNYNIQTLVSQINTKLTGKAIQCVFDQVSLKLSFHSNQTFSIVNTANNPTTIGDVIGVDVNDLNEQIFPIVPNVPPIFTIKMSRIVNLVSCQYLNIRINDFQIQSFASNGRNTMVFARVPLTSNFGSQCVYRPIEPLRYPITRKVVNALFIQVTTDSGEAVPADFDFAMEVTFQPINGFVETPDDTGTHAWFYRSIMQPILDSNEDFEEN